MAGLSAPVDDSQNAQIVKYESENIGIDGYRFEWVIVCYIKLDIPYIIGIVVHQLLLNTLLISDLKPVMGRHVKNKRSSGMLVPMLKR